MWLAPLIDEAAQGLEIQQLLAEREQLLGQLRDEEVREANEVAQARRRVATAEVEEREHRQATLDEQALCKLAEERLAQTEGGSAVAALHAASQGIGLRPEALMAEVQATKKQLQSARTARVALATARAASERQRLDEWVDAIRTSSQENQSLQANQQMALAHLKALEAMAASSASQANGREEALYGLLRHLEEHESAAFDLQQRSEVAESRLGVSTAELRRHEAATTSASRVSAQLNEHEELQLERARLHAEAHRLELEVGAAQEQLENGRRSLGPDETLRASVSELNSACEAAAHNANALSRRPPLLEAEVARLMTELIGERRLVVELEELKETYGGAEVKLRGRVDAEVLELESQLLAEGSGGYDLAERLGAEEEALVSELEAAEMRCQRLRSEAAEREEQFRTITSELQEQIDSLQKEELAEAQVLPARAVQESEFKGHFLQEHERRRPSLASVQTEPRPLTPSPTWATVPPPTQTPGVMLHSSSSPFLGAMGTASSSTSRPPGPLVDPGRGAEPPPRRGGVQTPRRSDQAVADYDNGITPAIAGAAAAGTTTLGTSSSTPALYAAADRREPRLLASQAPQALVQPMQERLAQRSPTPIQQLQERLAQRRAEMVAQQQLANEAGQHPYWLERSRYPPHALGVSPQLPQHEAYRTASHSPSRRMYPSSMRQADPGTQQMRAYSPIGRPELSASTATVVPGSSNSFLYRTYNGSADTTPFRTPPPGQADRASPLASTQPRRGANALPVLLSEVNCNRCRNTGLDFMGKPCSCAHGQQQALPASLEATARGGTPPGRARMPPERAPPLHELPSVAWQSAGMQGSQAAPPIAGAAMGPGGGRQSSPPPRSLSLNTIHQAETEVLGMAAHLADAQERRAAFQARIAELKGVIGASLQSLDEEEAADARGIAWSAVSRARAFAEREAALRPGS